MKPESIIEHTHHDLDGDMKAVDRTYKAAVDTMITLPQKEALKALYDAAQAMHINCTKNIDMLREGMKGQGESQLTVGALLVLPENAGVIQISDIENAYPNPKAPRGNPYIVVNGITYYFSTHEIAAAAMEMIAKAMDIRSSLHFEYTDIAMSSVAPKVPLKFNTPRKALSAEETKRLLYLMAKTERTLTAFWDRAHHSDYDLYYSLVRIGDCDYAAQLFLSELKEMHQLLEGCGVDVNSVTNEPNVERTSPAIIEVHRPYEPEGGDDENETDDCKVQ